MYRLTNKPAETRPSRLINPSAYVDNMRQMWEVYGNTYTEVIENAWRTIWTAMHSQVNDHTNGIHVVPAVCGIGKTLGIRAAAAAICNDPENSKLGVLVVTRFTEQADLLAKEINELVGRQVAIAKHSKPSGRHTELEVINAQVLVITHAALLRSLRKGQDHHIHWLKGDRELRIIDEALDVINRVTIDRSSIADLIAELHRLDLWYKLEATHPKHIAFLDKIREMISAEALEAKDGIVTGVFSQVVEELGGLNLYELSGAIAEIPPSKWLLKPGEDRMETQQDLIDAVETLSDAIAVDHWLSTTPKRTWTASSLLIPEGFPSVVIMDATANVDGIYDLLGKRVIKYQPPPDARRFTNAIIHYLPTKAGLGKAAMEKGAKTRLPAVADWAKQTFSGTDHKVLFAMHQGVEEAFRVELGEPGFTYDTIHWGNIDGINSFADYDRLIILSIPYQPPYISPTALMAFDRPQDTADKRLLEELEDRTIAVQLTQLICRIGIRRVIDARGNCPPSEVYLLLPGHSTGGNLKPSGQRFLDLILTVLHDIQVDRWEGFSGYDGGTTGRKSQWETEVLVLAAKVQPGQEVSLKPLMREMTKTQRKNLMESIRNPASSISTKLREMGLAVIAKEGRGGYTALYRSAN